MASATASVWPPVCAMRASMFSDVLALIIYDSYISYIVQMDSYISYIVLMDSYI